MTLLHLVAPKGAGLSLSCCNAVECKRNSLGSPFKYEYFVNASHSRTTIIYSQWLVIFVIYRTRQHTHKAKIITNTPLDYLTERAIHLWTYWSMHKKWMRNHKSWRHNIKLWNFQKLKLTWYTITQLSVMSSLLRCPPLLNKATHMGILSDA